MVSTFKRSSLISCCVLIVLTSFIFPVSAVDSTYTFNIPQPMDNGFDGYAVVPIQGNSSYIPAVLVAWKITSLVSSVDSTLTGTPVSIGTFTKDSFDINFSTNNPDNQFMITWFYMYNGDTSISRCETASFSYSSSYSIHFNIGDVISLSSYPNARFLCPNSFSGLSQVNRLYSTNFTYNCLFDGDISFYEKLNSIHSSIALSLSKLDLTNSKLDTVNSNFNKVINHFVSLLTKVDYTNEQLDEIVSQFSELLEVSYNIDNTLTDFVYYYWDEFVNVTFPLQISEIVSRLDAILRILNRSGDVEQTTVDSSKVDEFADIEQSLLNNDDADSAIGDMEVSIDGEVYSFIWQLITDILNTHPAVFGLVITILTLGFLALILNR